MSSQAGSHCDSGQIITVTAGGGGGEAGVSVDMPGGRYTGSMDVAGTNPWDPAVHLDLALQIEQTCVVGEACGTVDYTDGATCTSTLTLVSHDNSSRDPIYNNVMAETVTSGSCVAEPSIAIALASGGLGFRTSRGQVVLQAGSDLGGGTDYPIGERLTD